MGHRGRGESRVQRNLMNYYSKSERSTDALSLVEQLEEGEAVTKAVKKKVAELLAHF